jgi:divalent anion:Na+ symporter, DASS family
MNKDIAKGLGILFLGAVIWFLPVPEGLPPRGLHLFAVFVATIVGFILKPLPIGAIAFSSVTFLALTGTLKPVEALSGFGTSSIWLIFSAFVFSMCFKKSGLGRRVAYTIMRAIGGSSLKLGYAVMLSDLVISPATVSNTARSGAIVFPIVRSLCQAFGSEPGPTARRIGAYLMQCSYQCDGITSILFLTASSANILVVALAAKALNIPMTWGMWALGAVVPGVVSLLVLPYFIYLVYPPEIKNTPEAKQLAKDELVNMGPMSRNEKITTGVFLGMLVLWCTSAYNQIDASVVAMLGVAVSLIFRVVEWKDVLKDETAWDTLIWMGSLIGLADYLSKLGVIPWFTNSVSASLVGMHGMAVLILITLVYVYAHYGFASITGHIVAMYVAFASLAIAAGSPPVLTVFLLGYASTLGMPLTHYAAGMAPIYFGAGYIEQGTWWRIGFMVSVVNLVIWLGLGLVWWKALGWW